METQIKMKKLKIKHLSYSSIKEFKKSPEHFYHYFTEEKIEKDVYMEGNLLHTLALQPELFKSRYTVYDPENRPDKAHTMAAKENKLWLDNLQQEAIENKKLVISHEVYTTSIEIAGKVRSNPVSGELIKAKGNVFEKEMKWKLKGFDHLGFTDIWNDAFICDLKFMANADPVDFHRKIFYYDLYLQAAIYQVADKKFPDFNDIKDFFFIAIDKTPPYGVSVNRMPNEYLKIGMNEYLGLLDQIKLCLKDNSWISYEFKAPFGSDGIFTVETPYQLRS